MLNQHVFHPFDCPHRPSRPFSAYTPFSAKQRSLLAPVFAAGNKGRAPVSQPPYEDWLAKVLASAGVASRRACIDLIKQGVVKVNQQVVTDPATKVDGAKDKIQVRGQPLVPAPSGDLHYFVVHKPPGYICSNVCHKEDKRAVDLLKPWLEEWEGKKKAKGQLPPRIYTVGRLDVATSGLLFLTNDGAWAHKVAHPSSDITKEYLATVASIPTKAQLTALRAGTEVDGVLVVPKTVELVTSSSSTSQQPGATTKSSSSSSNGSKGKEGGNKGPGSSSSSAGASAPGKASGSGRKQQDEGVIRIVVSEGRKHEVRELVAAAGLDIRQLKRIRVGGYVLPKYLTLGQYKVISAEAAARVFDPPPKQKATAAAAPTTPAAKASAASNSSRRRSSGGRGSGANSSDGSSSGSSRGSSGGRGGRSNSSGGSSRGGNSSRGGSGGRGSKGGSSEGLQGGNQGDGSSSGRGRSSSSSRPGGSSRGSSGRGGRGAGGGSSSRGSKSRP